MSLWIRSYQIIFGPAKPGVWTDQHPTQGRPRPGPAHHGEGLADRAAAPAPPRRRRRGGGGGRGRGVRAPAAPVQSLRRLRRRAPDHFHVFDPTQGLAPRALRQLLLQAGGPGKSRGGGQGGCRWYRVHVSAGGADIVRPVRPGVVAPAPKKKARVPKGGAPLSGGGRCAPRC